VILNQIDLCEHFLVLLDEPTMTGMGVDGNWVGREVDRALALGKNVVPLLVEGARLESVSMGFVRRRELLELNALQLGYELFEQTVDELVRRFLTQPRLQELRHRTAEEHFSRGQEAAMKEDWHVAESEFEQAVAQDVRPEYLQGRGVVRYNQDRIGEALTDLDAAIGMDPLAFELMNAKFEVLQNMDRLDEALTLMRDWQQQAEERASNFAKRIIARLDSGESLTNAVRSIPELTRIYWNRPEYEEIGASLEALIEHVGGKLQDRLRSELETWKQEHAPDPTPD
jgi:tetratricopeptide (TPR) repeat protein